MNRKELVNALAERTNTNKVTVDEFMTAFIDEVTATVSTGEPVIISGFAKFIRRQTKARMGRNPATGEAIRIKASKKVRITPLKAFKDAVLGNRAPAKKTVKRKAVRRPAAKKTVKRKAAKKIVKRKAVRRPAAKKTVKRKAAKKTVK